MARGRVHRLFALEISECLFDKKHQLVNSEAKKTREASHRRNKTRVRFHLWRKEERESEEASNEGDKWGARSVT